MIHIQYELLPSPLHGVGVFAAQNIFAGDVIYTPNPLLDVNISADEFNSLSPNEQKEIQYFGYFHEPSQKWHVAFDVIRFLNHGGEQGANVSQDDSMTLRAIVHIPKGIELLQNYSEIYPDSSEHYRRIGKQ